MSKRQKGKAVSGEVVKVYDEMRKQDAIVPKIIARNLRPRKTVRFGYDVDTQMIVYGPEIEVEHLEFEIDKQPDVYTDDTGQLRAARSIEAGEEIEMSHEQWKQLKGNDL